MLGLASPGRAGLLMCVQNALAHSTCLAASASSVLPLHFFFPLTGEDPSGKNVESLFPATLGLSLRVDEGRGGGFGQETPSLLNSSFLARTAFRLLSLHRLQLAGDGRERVVGLYRVTTQEPPRCHQIRVRLTSSYSTGSWLHQVCGRFLRLLRSSC